jgi:hypothetical protein
MENRKEKKTRQFKKNKKESNSERKRKEQKWSTFY